jgi:hypothetical protein
MRILQYLWNGTRHYSKINYSKFLGYNKGIYFSKFLSNSALLEMFISEIHIYSAISELSELRTIAKSKREITFLLNWFKLCSLGIKGQYNLHKPTEGKKCSFP